MQRSTQMLLAMTAACAVGFVAVTLVAYETAGGGSLDRAGLEGFIAMQSPLMHALTRAAARFGDPLQVGLLGLALAAVAAARGRARVGGLILTLLAVTSVSSQLLKDLLAHPRLQVVIDGGHIQASSLPSGHSTAAMALALAAVFAAPRRARPAAAVIGAALALVVGISVVSLGWHFPSDVLAGYLMATGWALILAAGLRALDRRWPARPRRGRPGTLTTLAERVSASGLRAGAVTIALIAVAAGLLVIGTHPRELAEFGRDHTTTVGIIAGMAVTALALPAAMAAALRQI